MSNPSQQQLQEANVLNDVSMSAAGLSVALTIGAAASASTGVGMAAVPFIEAAAVASDLISGVTGIASNSIELEEALHTHNKKLEIESAVGIGLNALQVLLPFVPGIKSLFTSSKVVENAEEEVKDAQELVTVAEGILTHLKASDADSEAVQGADDAAEDAKKALEDAKKAVEDAKSVTKFLIREASKNARPFTTILKASETAYDGARAALEAKNTIPGIINALVHTTGGRDALVSITTTLIRQGVRTGVDVGVAVMDEVHHIKKHM